MTKTSDKRGFGIFKKLVSLIDPGVPYFAKAWDSFWGVLEVPPCLAPMAKVLLNNFSIVKGL